MLQDKSRLRRDKDFKRIFKHGKSVFDSACGAKFEKNGKELSRFAVVVSTKVHKSAVKRNKIRRQYQEIIRLNLENLKIGYDVVLLTSKPALDLNYHEKETRLLKVFKKAGLL